MKEPMNPNPVFSVIVLLTSNSKKSNRPIRSIIHEIFSYRKKARNWCKNNWYVDDNIGLEIKHPDSKIEPIKLDIKH